MGPSLDEQIAADDPIRLLDVILSDLDWKEWEKVYPAAAGRPPIHPQLMAGAILYGMMNRIRSSRDLEIATRMRVDYHWLLGGLSVDHCTFARFRQRFGDKLEGLLGDLNREACKIIKGGAKCLAVDGTCMRSNSDRHGARTATRLQAKIDFLQLEFDEIMKEMDAQDKTDVLASDSIEALEKRKAGLLKQQAKLEKALEVARKRDETKRKKEGQNAREVRVPVTDPDSALLLNKDGGYAPNYTATGAVDVATGLIVDADVPTGGDEASAVQPAVEAAEEIFGHKPDQVLFDSNFVTGENLEFLRENNVNALAPSEAAKDDNPAMRPNPDQPISEEAISKLLNGKGTLGKAIFFYNAAADSYNCPMGRSMPLVTTANRPMKGGGTKVVKTYKCCDCSDCPLAKKCLNRKAKARTVARDEYEPLREELAARMRTDDGKELYGKRAPNIEGVFGCIKGAMGIRGFLTRGHAKVRTEWQWICVAYSMRMLMGHLTRKRTIDDTARKRAPERRAASISHSVSALFRQYRWPVLVKAA
jgi:hypothetical protein